MFKKYIALRSRQSVSRLFDKLVLVAALATAALTAPSAWAGWSAQQENVHANHPTWIYTPTTPTALASGKRALVIALHGCDQTNTQLKEWGNLTTGADAKGAVIAVPYVGPKVWNNNTTTKCWDYDGAADRSGHITELVSLAQTLIDPAGKYKLNIDPNHVYIIGISSGGGVAMDVACKAPDIFAGVSAIAGPSVGSSQSSAISDGGVISHPPATAAAKCKALAGAAKEGYFGTQIANFTYGEMDRNAETPGCSYSLNSTNCPGTYLLVTKKWSTINVDAYKSLYGTSSLSAPVPVANNTGETSSANLDGKPVLSLTRVYKVGHAWPAGSGMENSAARGGVWMAQKGMDYTSYMVDWLISNNRRKPKVEGPVVTKCSAAVASASATSVTVSGTGEHRGGGTIASYKVVLNGPTQITDPAAGSGTGFSIAYNLANGNYTGTVTASDSNGLVSEPCTLNPFQIGTPVLLPPDNLSVTGTTASSVSLSWSASNGATGYNVYRDGVKITNAPVTASGHTDTTGLAPETSYRYSVSAVNSSGESKLSPEVVGTTKPKASCVAVTSSNYVHVTAGRAYLVPYTWRVAAKGSNQDMGLFSFFYVTKLAPIAPGHYIVGDCPTQ